jgi:catechol 2,3-dioxygenase-like lactoylglutathione lyase family enzyme
MNAEPVGAVSGFDHVSLPMQQTDAMVAFYRALGFDVAELPHVVSVYVGNQMINLHRPATWQRAAFTLRAPNAQPPCGDLCFVWDGSAEALSAHLDDAGAEIIEGPVAREGGRRAAASSVYTRDPDGNLLEFMIYGDDSAATRRPRQGEASAGERSVESTHQREKESSDAG